jgi:hypothetical protein
METQELQVLPASPVQWGLQDLVVKLGPKVLLDREVT